MKNLLKFCFFLFFKFSVSFTQCAMCKAVIEQQNSTTDLKGLGINTAILFLVLIVYVFWILAFGKKIKKFLRELIHFYD